MNKIVWAFIAFYSGGIYAQSVDHAWSRETSDNEQTGSVLPNFEVEEKEPNLVDEMPADVRHV